MIIKEIRTLNSDDRQVIVLDDSPDDLSLFARLIVKAMLEEGVIPPSE